MLPTPRFCALKKPDIDKSKRGGDEGFFQVVDDAQLSQIFWQPDSGRLVTIANVAS